MVLLQCQRSSAYVIVSIFLIHQLWEVDVHEGERPSHQDSGESEQAIITGLVMLTE